MTNPKSLKKAIEEIAQNVAIDIYCDETCHLGDELERNEHEIREATENICRAAPKIIQLFMERVQKTLDEIKEKNKPFTMSGIIERESIFYEIKRALIQLAIEVE